MSLFCRLQGALTWQRVLGCALYSRHCQGPGLVQLRPGKPPEEPAGCREEGTVLSCTDQEAPAVADLPAPIHVGQHEGEGLPEEERRDSDLPTRPVMANL